jgi:hypothetical protein
MAIANTRGGLLSFINNSGKTPFYRCEIEQHNLKSYFNRWLVQALKSSF